MRRRRTSSAGGDKAAREIAVPPPERGTIFRIAEFPAGLAMVFVDADEPPQITSASG